MTKQSDTPKRIHSFLASVFVFAAVFFAGILFGMSIFFPQETKATKADTLSGWAWSSNIGWISFNCANQGSCATSPYGVTTVGKGTVKKLSGFAWSSNIGWITFNEAQLSGRPAVTIDTQSGEAQGWARAYTCASPGCQGAPNGWDGWIHFAGPHYSSPNLSGNGGVTVDTSACKFVGYAWGGGNDANFPGWIHFAGSTYQVSLTPSVCIAGPVVVTLAVTPPVGDAPLPATLTATVLLAPGKGLVTFTFDCITEDDGPLDPTPPAFNGTNPAFSCVYTARGKYTAWVKAEQAGASPGTASASVIVKPPIPIFKEK